MNVYPVKIVLDGEETTVTLKLDARHLRTLEEMSGKNSRDILLAAYDSMGTLCDVLDAALHYKGNDNPKIDGYDLIDALTETGAGGEVSWARIVTRVGIVSGVFGKEVGQKLLDGVEKAVADTLSEEENPT